MQVEVDSARLWFDVDGPVLMPDGYEMRERPTVVLLHGGPGSFDHSYFKPEFARLALTAQVVYLDLPGHGRSDWGDPAQWSFDLCADRVQGFCEAVGIRRPVIYGHSLGGFVALVHAVRHPGRAVAYVLQSTTARMNVDELVERFRRVGGDEIADVVRRSYGGDRASVTPEEWAPCWKLFGHWVPGEQERARAIANVALNAPGLELMREFDVLDRLGAADRPALVCCGELDPMTPVEAHREIAAALPRGRLEIIEDAGHFTWKDAPDRYWPLIEEFVRSAVT
jgi:pimeloyl-ACP methyl ester carboxylesterase